MIHPAVRPDLLTWLFSWLTPRSLAQARASPGSRWVASCLLYPQHHQGAADEHLHCPPVCLCPRPGVVWVSSPPRQESQGQEDRGPFLAEGATWVQTDLNRAVLAGCLGDWLREKPLLPQQWARPLDNLSSSFLMSKCDGVGGGPLTDEGEAGASPWRVLPGSQIRRKLWPGSCLCSFLGKGWRGLPVPQWLTAMGGDSWILLPEGGGFSVAVHKGVLCSLRGRCQTGAAAPLSFDLVPVGFLWTSPWSRAWPDPQLPPQVGRGKSDSAEAIHRTGPGGGPLGVRDPLWTCSEKGDHPVVTLCSPAEEEAGWATGFSLVTLLAKPCSEKGSDLPRAPPQHIDKNPGLWKADQSAQFQSQKMLFSSLKLLPLPHEAREDRTLLSRPTPGAAPRVRVFPPRLTPDAHSAWVAWSACWEQGIALRGRRAASG